MQANVLDSGSEVADVLVIRFVIIILISDVVELSH